MFERPYQPGDLVICRIEKFSTHPSPRAKELSPARHGEHYRYAIDKFWVVHETRDDGTLVVRTRRGKLRSVPSDARVHRARWWERLIYRDRFPAPSN